jgi:protein disulfide-isomerase-like protein
LVCAFIHDHTVIHFELLLLLHSSTLRSFPPSSLVQWSRCGHCKNLAPIYEEVAKSLEGESSVVVANVDADKYRELGSRFDVQGFPTLKWFPKGNKKGEEYSGGRTAAEFMSFFQQKSGVKRTVGGGMCLRV